jgi:hypothetical protein
MNSSAFGICEWLRQMGGIMGRIVGIILEQTRSFFIKFINKESNLNDT